jgi:hypothetical protein
MSGPKTVIITANPVAALLAAASISAAAAVYEGYAHAAVLRQQHQDSADALKKFQNASETQGRAAINEQANAAEQAFDHLSTLADKLGMADMVRATRPLQPDPMDSVAIAAYTRALHELIERLRDILLTEAARQSEELITMPEFSLHAAASVAVPQNISQRLLARIAHLGSPPVHIEKIALELQQALPGDRADLLATELRAQIQAHIEALQKRQVQEATALIVMQSLKDLGYQVEEMSDTLFVEGGVVHFRRQQWGNYLIRMRIDAKAESANFNVIRSVAEGENERSVLDHLAEDRWCAEFPTLLQALEVRGVHMNVTRHLQAGELPVQLVEFNKLPKFIEEDNTVPILRSLAKRLP